MVAIVHAFTTMYLAVRLSFMCWPLEIGAENTPGQTTVVNVAGGFFLYDIISWAIYGYVINKCVSKQVLACLGARGAVLGHATAIVRSIRPQQSTHLTASLLLSNTHTNRYDYPQLFHHGACLLGMWACWATDRSGADCTFALFIAELANPFMYLRYLLREVGWHSTPLARTNQVCVGVRRWGFSDVGE